MTGDDVAGVDHGNEVRIVAFTFDVGTLTIEHDVFLL